jgi:energy-coupling factor transport system substrate-specific component
MLLSKDENKIPDGKGAKKIVEFVLLVIAADLICTLFVGGWVSLTLGLVPYKVLGVAVVVNNVLAPAILGPILILALYPRLKKWGLLWYEIMEKDISGRPKSVWGVVSIWIAAIGTGLTLLAVLNGTITETVALYLHIIWAVLTVLSIFMREKEVSYASE